MLIGFTGYAQSGKSTCAEYLSKDFGFTQVGFADKLREFVERVNPVVFVGEDGAQILRYNDVLSEYGYEMGKKLFPGFRQALIDVGNGARDVFHPDFWVLELRKSFKPGVNYSFQDVRFLNEARAIQQFGDGIVIRVVRPGIGPLSDDPSELEMEQITPDYTIENNLSKDILLKNVHYYVTKHVRP